MDGLDRWQRFDFDDDRISDQEIETVRAFQPSSLVINRQMNLTAKGNLTEEQLSGQAF